MSAETKTFSLEREVPLPRSKVWELLSHTDHFNQVIGLAPVHFSPVADDDLGLVREATSRLMGLPMRWKEFPFQWIKGESYTVLRLYDAGPLKKVDMGVEMRDAATQLPSGEYATILRVFADIVPRSSAVNVGLPLFMRRNLLNTFKYCESYLKLESPTRANTLPQASPPPAINMTQLRLHLKELARYPVERQYVAWLGNYLQESADNEVAGLRPYVLAGEWDAPSDEILRLCLYATKAGLLNLSWKMMCPNCRVAKAEYASLGQLKDKFHCDLCGVTYSANFDRYVELRFAVHSQIRQATEQTYCIGGPSRTPQIIIQQSVLKDKITQLKFPAVDEPMRLRVLRANHIINFGWSEAKAGDEAAIFGDELTDDVVAGAAADPAPVALDAHEPGAPVELLYRDTGWSPRSIAVPAPGTPLRIINRSGSDIIVALEKIHWDENAVTAAKVTSMQEFRSMFSSEVLAPGQSVSIENLTVFFSDLRDSTVLYEMAGDAPAYSRVRDHFDFMFERIQTNSGSIVKTIGDAVMAVFYSPEDALHAAFEIQRDVVKFNAKLPAGESISIKIGLHYGPAIAINSNDRLDYFGRTVNIASRIEGASLGDDIVISSECVLRSGIREMLKEYSFKVQRFQTSLKGIEGNFELYRVQL